MSGLVLSIFPGLGLLDRAFEAEGFCCVRGPDVIWGGDVRTFHPPSGRFDGVIGGDPCQSHSSLSNLVLAKGLEPSFPDLTPEFQRVIEAAQPRWFLRENVPKAPDVKPMGYEVHSFLLCNSWLDAGDGHGEEQMRKRRFWFGWPSEYGPAPHLMRWIRQAVFEPSEPSLAVNAGHDHLDVRPREKVQTVAGDARAVAVAVAVGGSGKRKATATKAAGVTGSSRHRLRKSSPGYACVYFSSPLGRDRPDRRPSRPPSALLTRRHVRAPGPTSRLSRPLPVHRPRQAEGDRKRRTAEHGACHSAGSSLRGAAMTKLAYRDARIRALKREILRLETKGKHEKHIAPLRRELRRLEGER